MQPLVEAEEFLQIKEQDYELILEKCGLRDRMVRESIDNIKSWYNMQLHFPECGFSDGHFFRFLLVNNFSLEKTKNKIDNLLTARSLIPEITSDRNPYSESMKSTVDCTTFAIIPERLDDMTRLIFAGFKNENSSNFVFLSYLKMLLMGQEYLAFTDVYMGYHYIVNWKGLKTSDVAQISPTLLKKGLMILTECFGTKVKSIHHINVPIYGEWVFNALKAVLSKKMKLRIVTHRDPGSLQNFFPKSIIPSDFGGENKPIKEFTEELYDGIKSNREMFLRLEQQKTDESKRVGVGSAFSEELQGLQGSFRSLDVD